MTATPAVTIGVPTFRRGPFIGDAVRQILAQSYTDFELIVVDDCSPDETGDAVRAFSDARLRYVRNDRNLGIPGNLNRILQLARGSHIIILHDHDLFHPDLLLRLKTVYDAHPSLGFVHPGVAWVDHTGVNPRTLLAEFPEVMPGRELERQMISGPSFSCPVTACSLVSRRAYEAVGMHYDAAFGFLSDVDLWLRLAHEFDVGYVREALLTCREREPGHEFAGVNWKVIGWASEVFRAAIDRAFPAAAPERVQALAQWRRKTAKSAVRSLLSCGVRGDVAGWDEGLKYCGAQGEGSFGAIARRVGAMPWLSRSAQVTLRVVGALR